MKRVEVEADREREVHVTVDPDRLGAAGLTLGQLSDAIAGANVVVPGSDLVTEPSV